MSVLRYIILGGAVLVSSAIAAQTLEESYAKLCSGANKGSESCQVLRKALQEKLAAEDDMEPAGATPGSARAAKPAPSAPIGAARWGFWAALPDSGSFKTGRSIQTYSWKEKNKIMEFRDEVAGTSATVVPAEGNGIEWVTDAGRLKMVEETDGSFLQIDPAGAYRIRYSAGAEGIKTTIEVPKDGAWAFNSESIAQRLTPQQLAEARAAIQRAKTPEGIRENWGIYAHMVGKTFVHKLYETRYVWSYEWVEPGLSMARRFAALTKDKISSPPTPNVASILYDPVGKKLSSSEKMQPDGTMVLDMQTMRTTTRMTAGGYEEVTDELKNGKWKHLQTARYTVEGGGNIDATLASLTAPKQKGNGGGLLGAIAGAVGGAAAGAASGGGTEAILGGAAKGAAMFSGDAGSAAALNVAGDSLLGGDPTAFAAAATGASGSGSYATRPNALGGSSACSMMNEGNYRQVGLEGGNDAQLKTMCAQAYEYYTMYKRAISQGYAEADANRTYDAHNQAAQNAMSFYANNRAN